MKTGQCYICQRKDLVDSHHVIMQAAGGEAGPVVDLCKTCHGKIHAQALNFESKSPNSMLFTQGEWLRAKRLVDYIILALRKNRENPDFNNPYNLQIKLKKRDVFLLHVMKDQAGYTNLNAYMIDLIRGHIRKKFPQA